MQLLRSRWGSMPSGEHVFWTLHPQARGASTTHAHSNTSLWTYRSACTAVRHSGASHLALKTAYHGMTPPPASTAQASKRAVVCRCCSRTHRGRSHRRRMLQGWSASWPAKTAASCTWQTRLRWPAPPFSRHSQVSRPSDLGPSRLQRCHTARTARIQLCWDDHSLTPCTLKRASRPATAWRERSRSTPACYPPGRLQQAIAACLPAHGAADPAVMQ